VTRFSDRTIVLVKHFTVVEDLPHVQTELVFGLVTAKPRKYSWTWFTSIKFRTYLTSYNFFLIVDKSIGVLMIFLYVGNCFVFTGSKNGHASSWHSRSSKIALQGASSLSNFFGTRSFLELCVDGEPALPRLELETSLWLQFVVAWSSFVVTELWDGAGLTTKQNYLKTHPSECTIVT
jgi:hypothetical protein